MKFTHLFTINNYFYVLFSVMLWFNKIKKVGRMILISASSHNQTLLLALLFVFSPTEFRNSF